MENNLPQGWEETGDVRIDKIMPELFSGWIVLPFEECLSSDIGTYKKLKQKDTRPEGQYPVIDQGEELINGYIDDEIFLYQGELPIIIFGDHTRRIKFLDFKFAVGADGTKILKPKGFIKIEFFYYYLLSLKISSEGYSRHYKFLKEINIPIPPLLEQHRVVARLDALFEKLESNKQRLERIPQILKRFRQCVLAAAVSGKLTEEWRKKNAIVDGWEEVNLDSITTLVTSGSRGWAKYYSESGSTFVRAQNISKDVLDLSDIAFVKLPNTTEGIRTLIKENDILITITGANVTKTAHINFNIKDAYVSQHVGLVRVKNTVSSKFIYLFLISESHGRKQLLASAYGQGKPQLNLDNIKEVQISLPLIEEQKEIVRRVEQLFAFADKIEARYTKAKAMLDKLPQSILAKAFRGELTPQNPNDEPASVLLERIKKEKDIFQQARNSRKRKTAGK